MWNVSDWNDPQKQPDDSSGERRPWESPDQAERSSRPQSESESREWSSWGDPSERGRHAEAGQGAAAGDRTSPTGPGQQHRWTPDGSGADGKGGFRLTPMTFADLLDTTFKLLKANWRQLAIVAAVYVVPATILQFIALIGADGQLSVGSSNTSSVVYEAWGNSRVSDEIGRILLAGLFSVLLSIGLLPYVQGAITRLVASSYLNHPITAEQALRSTRPHWKTLVLANLLVLLCTMGGLVLLIIGAIVVSILCVVVNPVVVLEGGNARRAVSRSWGLVSKRFWAYLGTLIVIAVIELIIGIGVGLVIGQLGSAILGDRLGHGLANVVNSTIGLCIGGIVVTLFYFDARVRSEGYDLQMMFERVNAGSTGGPAQGSHAAQGGPVGQQWGPAQRTDEGPATGGAADQGRTPPDDTQPPLTH
jgi:hypothetical protein